jgi:hydrogenase maturation protease
MTSTRVVVFACGNPSRGDDALGPALMAWLEAWLRRNPGTSVRIVEDFQFQVEDTLDLQACELALFVDASATAPDPFEFLPLTAAAQPAWSTHALSPAALLQAYMTLGFGAPPPAFLLGVRGHSFILGEPLTPQAGRNQEAAWALLERLLEDPRPNAWLEECGTATCS